MPSECRKARYYMTPLGRLDTGYFIRLLLMFSVSLSVSCLVCGRIVGAKPGVIPNQFDARRRPLPPMSLDAGVIGRSLIRVPQGEFIVMHSPERFLSRDSLAAMLRGDPGTTEDDLEQFVEPPGSPWHVSDDNLSQYTTFNCATHAIGDAVGLSKSDWLEPLAAPWTESNSGVAFVLQHFFDLKSVHPLSEDGWQSLESSPLVRDGDVVSFVDANSGGGHRHLARVDQRNGRTLLVGKLSTGPIAQGSIARTALYFRGGFTELRIYRRQGE